MLQFAPFDDTAIPETICYDLIRIFSFRGSASVLQWLR